jgi:hypothetical protein
MRSSLSPEALARVKDNNNPHGYACKPCGRSKAEIEAGCCSSASCNGKGFETREEVLARYARLGAMPWLP